MYSKPAVLLALLLAPPTAAPSAPSAERPGLKSLKALAGDWELVDPAGQTTDLRARYEVVAGGSAVVETLFAGLPVETVTVYHLEEAQVSATHLGGRGALARLAPAASGERDTVRFENPAPDPRPGALLETRTLPSRTGWAVTGVPFRLFLQDQAVRFASTYASEGDAGTTLAHYGFEAGRGCRVRFSVLGGHGYVVVVEETEAPPRRIQSIPELSVELLAGEYGQPIERIVGERWVDRPRAVEWDLSRLEGQALRLYVVDAASDHFGQLSVFEVSILEDAPE